MNTGLAIDDGLRATSDTATVAPCRTMTATEAALARIWAAVLECERVGRDDNFFLLGGDSLRAAALFAEVESVFGVTLPLETMFDEAETVAGMAKLIEQHRGAAPDGGPAEATAPTRQGAIPLIERGDLTAAITLLTLACVAWLPRRRALPAVCRLLARVHLALRGRRMGKSETVEAGVVAGSYEDIASALREYIPLGRHPTVRLRGRAHLDGALAAGRGAVLWNFAGRPGSRAAAQYLTESGIPLVQLRSHAHPLSGSKLGMRILNPIVNRSEDRYLKASVVLHEDAAAAAMQELGRHLRSNAAVRITAHGAGDTPHEMPFLGGTLRLALGAPTLALLHVAPLLPIFSIPDGSGGFDVTIEAPLRATRAGTPVEMAREMAESYAAILERYVRRHPHLWRGWVMRHTWRRESGRGPGDA